VQISSIVAQLFDGDSPEVIAAYFKLMTRALKSLPGPVCDIPSLHESLFQWMVGSLGLPEGPTVIAACDSLS